MASARLAPAAASWARPPSVATVFAGFGSRRILRPGDDSVFRRSGRPVRRRKRVNATNQTNLKHIPIPSACSSSAGCRAFRLVAPQPAIDLSSVAEVGGPERRLPDRRSLHKERWAIAAFIGGPGDAGDVRRLRHLARHILRHINRTAAPLALEGDVRSERLKEDRDPALAADFPG